MIPASFLLVILLAPSPPQRACDPGSNPFCTEIQRIAGNVQVRSALESVRADAARARSEMIELTEIPAPPFQEDRRAHHFLEMLRDAGADSVWMDEAGNALGLRRGTIRDRRILIEGHLDTVFPDSTDVVVTTRGDTLLAPGIADDARGLVAVLGVLRAMSAAAIRTQADVWFVGTVGEEGLGDLRGVKYLFRPGAAPIDAYIALEPGGDRITTAGLGSHRYRVSFHGPGGHSWGAFGTASPVHALGRAIGLFDRVAEVITSDGPRSSYNVGRIGGGTSINSIAFEAWMEVDLRSDDRAKLDTLDRALNASVRRALSDENAGARPGTEPLTVELLQVGDRPSGSVRSDDPLVLRASAVIEHFGGTPAFGSGSTNANLPLSRGVPAVTIGAGGTSGDSHALTEWWTDADGMAYLAIQRALLLLLATAGFVG